MKEQWYNDGIMMHHYIRMLIVDFVDLTLNPRYEVECGSVESWVKGGVKGGRPKTKPHSWKSFI